MLHSQDNQVYVVQKQFNTVKHKQLIVSKVGRKSPDKERRDPFSFRPVSWDTNDPDLRR